MALLRDSPIPVDAIQSHVVTVNMPQNLIHDGLWPRPCIVDGSLTALPCMPFHYLPSPHGHDKTVICNHCLQVYTTTTTAMIRTTAKLISILHANPLAT